ncbi:MAG: competence protein ComEA [Flavobacteriales bacterium]|jgi:competence protein ComEA
MRHFLKNQFYFTKRERNGIIVLLGILVLVNLVMAYRKYSQPNVASDTNAFFQEIAAIEDSIRADKLLEKSRHSPALFDFDPNAASKEQLIALGTSDKVAQTIVNYRNKGGRFYSNKDLERVYGISKKLVDSWTNHLIYPLKSPSNRSKPKVKKDESVTKVIVPVSLNNSDTAQLKQVPGIGSYFAKQIVSYRLELGGFREVEQLLEIYLVDSSKLEQWLPHLILDIFSVRFLNINKSTIQQLSKHPYLSYKIASAIVKFREQHGEYQNINALKKLHLIDEAIFRKIAPYLKVNDK